MVTPEILESKFEDMKEQLERIEIKLDKFIDNSENKWVTKTEFSVVKNIVFGMCATILLSVLGAIVGLVIIKP